ncbi:cation transport regulator ChaC [Halospina denitrificans]|uniref:glutathione-specific gamma-glutamylcyclotransferase n=1 Tax=Halospina denitrificans TaxID=332522 RepID=A0A4R7K1C3_9GAMM|nr:gamma-glutamylcyclotransferase [Halospina denitrificans]TDT44246.1 cation transport regulator ChaC [Halospina denitrificans]
MSANTIERNQSANLLPEDGQPVWLFGYGSLIYKVGFEFLEARQATLDGWKRRFWQGSHDHRGTPERPGRVVTLMPDSQARCTGIAYRVSPDVFSHLDVREKNGYLRLFKPLTLNDGDSVDALVYIATEDNPAFAGPAPEYDIAARILQCQGPSGPNADYALALAGALRHMQVEDPHVFEIERQLRAMLAADNKPHYSSEAG